MAVDRCYGQGDRRVSFTVNDFLRAGKVSSLHSSMGSTYIAAPSSRR